MPIFNIFIERSLGFSHSGEVCVSGDGSVELTDEEVKQLIELIREKGGVTDVDELVLEERYPENYKKLDDACYEIASYAISKGLNIWCYTGYTFEQLLELGKKKKGIMDFLSCIDVLVDGKFMMEHRSLDAKYCGSTNQRLIDVKKSLEGSKVCLWEDISSKSIISFKRNEHIYV